MLVKTVRVGSSTLTLPVGAGGGVGVGAGPGVSRPETGSAPPPPQAATSASDALAPSNPIDALFRFIVVPETPSDFRKLPDADSVVMLNGFRNS